MEVIFILVAISMVVAGGFLISFLRNMKSGQYDDMYTPSVRILFDNHKKTDNKQEDVTIRGIKK
ncbi:MAG: cbb3-type cytochrome oxidase assembly protein CcoS [Chitinophagaceae bacterium]|nr:MAG: cbb3-type cytochrome oxidase assembly protein CcoS [Chitinophagaceae bacterium]